MTLSGTFWLVELFGGWVTVVWFPGRNAAGWFPGWVTAIWITRLNRNMTDRNFITSEVGPKIFIKCNKDVLTWPSCKNVKVCFGEDAVHSTNNACLVRNFILKRVWSRVTLNMIQQAHTFVLFVNCVDAYTIHLSDVKHDDESLIEVGWN